jgi:hypothetical protein
MILAVGPLDFQAPRGGGPPLGEHLRRGHRVIKRRAGHRHGQQPSQGLDPYRALAPGDVLAAILAALAAPFGGLHRLAGNAGGTGMGSCEDACCLRTSARRRSIMCCQVPSCRHCTKYS